MPFPSYTTGTISIANGAAVAVGSGTMWSPLENNSNILFVPSAGLVTLVETVTDDTHLAIQTYGGTAIVAADYALLQLPLGSFTASQALVNHLARLAQAGIFYFVGAGETPDDSFGNDGDFALQVSPIQVWTKISGVWVVEQVAFPTFIISTEVNSLEMGFEVEQIGQGTPSYVAAEHPFGFAYNRVHIDADKIDVSGFPVGAQATNGFVVELYPSNGSKGLHNAFVGSCWIAPGVTIDHSNPGLTGICGALLYGATDSVMGGTNTGAGALGSVFGANPFARAGVGVTNLYGVVGVEIDVLMAAGSTTARRVGLGIADVGSSVSGVQGVQRDAAIVVGAFIGSAHWRNVIEVSDYYGGPPLDQTNGRFIYAPGTYTGKSFAEAPNYTFSDYIFLFSTFRVNGAGALIADGGIGTPGGLAVSAGGASITGGLIGTGPTTLTSNSATALTVGPGGATNPVLLVDGSAGSQATGVTITGNAAGSAANITARSSGTNETLAINAKGSGDIVFGNVSTGQILFGHRAAPSSNGGAALGSTALGWSGGFWSSGATQNYANGDFIVTHSTGVLTFGGKMVITSNAAHAFAVGPNGDTNPTLAIVCNTASAVTGLTIGAAAAGGGVGINAQSTASAELLAINAKGTADLYLQNSATGAVRIGAAGLFPITDDGAALGSAGNRWSDIHLATGAVTNYQNGNYTITHSSALLTFSGAVTVSGATTLSAALTYGGVALSNAVTGTGNMVLSAAPTFTGTTTIATLALTTVGAHTISGAITYGGVTLSNAVTGTGNMVLSASPAFTGTIIAAAATLSGTLTVSQADPTITVNKTNTSGHDNSIIGQTNGVNRWLVNVGNNSNEAGTNAGSNFDINRYSDAGSFLATALSINRATGAVTVAQLATGSLTSASGVITSSSDETMKDITGYFTRSIGDLMKMDPAILYHWNKESGIPVDEQHAGYTAQGVRKGIPEAVSVGPNGKLSLSDRPIIAATVNALLNHESRIAALEQRKC